MTKKRNISAMIAFCVLAVGFVVMNWQDSWYLWDTLMGARYRGLLRAWWNADGGHVDRKEYTAADLNWGDGVIGANAYKEWMGGLPVQSLVGIGITVSGVDANGNRQAFYGYVEFSNE